MLPWEFHGGPIFQHLKKKTFSPPSNSSINSREKTKFQNPSAFQWKTLRAVKLKASIEYKKSQIRFNPASVTRSASLSLHQKIEIKESSKSMKIAKKNQIIPARDPKQCEVYEQKV